MERGNFTINHWTVSLMVPKENSVILEIGCGNGSTINYLSGKIRYKKIHGIDISDVMIRESKKNNRQLIKTGSVEINHSDVLDLPFSDSYFDSIFSVHTIYFWRDIKKGFAEIYRTLRPKGSLYLSFANIEYLKRLERTKGNFQLYHEDEIIKCLRDIGFSDLRVERKGQFVCIIAGK